MPGVYVYDFDDVDLDTTGRVGDLQPVECYFDEEKNGDSVLTLRLIYDELNKWAAVKVGSYIKAMVPVRVPPKISSLLAGGTPGGSPAGPPGPWSGWSR